MHACVYCLRMLYTEFIKVAQSGATIDGREIAPQDLRDIAESYSPSTYEAVIWPEHERFFGNHGTVAAVEARENGELVELYAKFKPGWRFLEKNKEGQKLYSSIEIWDNFGNSGKAYLAGIAITDTPASLGTEQIRLFTAQRTKHSQQTGEFYSGVELPSFFAAAAQPDEQKPEAYSLFQRLGAALFGSNHNEPETEEESMTEEQFNQLLSALTDTKAAVDGLAGNFNSQQAQPEPEPAKAEPENNFSAQLEPLVGSMNKLAEQFGAMAQRMEGAAYSTSVPENANPASGNALI
ncbi:Phage capsid scaffolding protein (GPO) serine peptidase [Halodesulfovibrio marinisediminis DSM 17456]|uniref:Phage capsid scaffolding protein (GPO) serine peptidase n=2 Tax=Halodesulfovibrio marinisediminis TaxID=458711 RepID=A0A1N6DPJ3_9BACT|nr:Phage capsid scaffolding protein (GPO) serine peptidase [Halodesulfovibrio marinisediminis DSM 17456]